MPKITIVLLLAGCMFATACNTVQGAKQDAASVGRVFTHHPDGSAP